MGLGKYFAKRSFKKTPEPKGAVKKSASKKLAFVVQEHHATALHYDFRLEMDGVLKSWAVPKGPSMDPHQHHLAVQTEDHPYEYRKFEGVIPEGNYGAGNVIIWDEGWYEPRTETDDPEKTLLEELQNGHVTFVLHGKKLHGEFALIQMHKQGDSAWLLIKKGDSFASTEDITQQNESIKTGRTVDQLGAHNKLPDLSRLPKKAPWQPQPMLCTLIEEPFDRPDWLFEIKWDGFRAIGTKHKNQVSLRSRNNIDFMEKFPPVAEALHDLDHDVIVDGEIVVVDADGTPHFEWLQDWKRTGNGELRYQVFDILWCDGHDVRTMPLRDRKALLHSIIPAQSAIKYSDHVEEKGAALFAQMQHHNLEGIVAKRADSTYQENVRGADWLKIKTHLRQEVVIGGFTEPRGSRTYLGSLIVGVYNKGTFEYVGHSGGGIPDAQRKELRQKLEKLERKTSPFSTDIPKSDTSVHWVKPELVCEMNFAEWTSGGQMRQPKFVGMREDKKPMNVKREKPAGKTIPTAKPEFSHLDKVFFPKHNYTKGDLIAYYQSVAKYILPYLADRPHSLLRQPGGVTDHGFFQKNMEHLPEWAPTADIYSESNQANIHWLVGGKLETLEYMVQLGCIEINPWNARVQHLDKPDWAVMDLDPEGVTFDDVITVARTVHDICTELHITAVPKTSGKTGIHIYMPLGAKYTHNQAKDFVHLLAMEVNKRQPKLTSLERMPAKRPNKIYLDYLQNREGQTLAAPYSVRPTPDATVATPLHWDEVKKGLLPTDYTIKNINRRLARVGDLWKPVLGPGNDLAKVLKHMEKLHKDQETNQ